MVQVVLSSVASKSQLVRQLTAVAVAVAVAVGRSLVQDNSSKTLSSKVYASLSAMNQSSYV